MKNFTIKTAAPSRLDELLRRELPLFLNTDISNGKIRRLIIAGAVSVNGRQCKIPSFNLKSGSSVTAFIEEEKLFYEKDAGDINFVLTQKDVLFEDDDIIVVNKPAFFPTEAGMVKSRNNLHDAVVDYLHAKNPSLRNPPYVGIMHRLDKETSGAILFTKTRAVNAACHDMFENRSVQKIYTALSASSRHIDKKNFSVEFYMARVSPKSKAAKWGRVAQTFKDAQWSKTNFRIVSETPFKNKTLYKIECSLETGRTHQIRVHLSDAGLPILGDELYGGQSFRRIMLHAGTLIFPHPKTGSLIKIEAPLPEEFKI